MSLQGRLDGRRMRAGYDDPTAYTPVSVGGEDANKVSAHLKGVNTALAGRPRLFSATYGDGSTLVFTLTPGFQTQACVVQIFEVSTGKLVMTPQIETGLSGATQVRLTYPSGAAPTAGQFRVVILG